MQPGNPSVLLTEELIDLTRELGHINQYALSAQEMLENMESSYAITWFLFNARTLKAHLISAAFCLDEQERPLKFFQRLADVEPPEGHITIHDLGTVFAVFKTKIGRVQRAYSSYADISRPAKAFFEAALQQLKLMTWNLKQAQEI